MPKTRSSTVKVKLPPELKAIVDTEVARLRSLGSKVRVTREDAIQSLVRRHVRNLQPGDVQVSYEQYLREAGLLKLHGMKRRSLNEIGPARQAFLRAAAFELMALSILDDPADTTIIHHLMEIVGLVKDGTGYKSLPEASRGAKLMTTTGSA